MSSSNWKIATKDINPDDALMIKLRDQAITAAPDGFVKVNANGDIVSENLIKMLPRHRLRGYCRLCGKESDLTEEHIPPQASGNKGRHQNFTLDDWLKYRFTDSPQVKRTIEQGGISGYTLCDKCNSFTGHYYGNEYKRWVQQAKYIIECWGVGAISKLNQMNGPLGEEVVFGNKKSGPVKPGAMVRQVLSFMCSLSGSWNLAERHPEIRRIILDQSKEPLPINMELGMSLYLGPKVRICGPQLILNAKTEKWRWCQELAFPPFSFLLVMASNEKKPGLGLMIGDWCQLLQIGN